MGSCVICLTDSLPSIHVDSSEWKKCNVKPIIEKHLWWWHLQQSLANSSSYICQQCWSMLSSFHTFYLEVEKLHQQYNEKIWPVLKRSTKQGNSKSIRNSNENSNETHEPLSSQNTENDYIIRIATNNETIELLPCLEIDKNASNYTFDGGHTPEYKAYISKEENDQYLEKSAHQLICDICNITLSDFSDIKYHYRQVHGITGYASCCKKRFYSRAQLADHLRVHENPFYFQCSICTRILSHRVSYEKHQKIHKTLQEQDLVCDTCKKSFSEANEYERHILSHCQSVSSDYIENETTAINNESFTNYISLNCFIPSQNTEIIEQHPVVKSENVSCTKNAEQIDTYHFEQPFNTDQNNCINIPENTETQGTCRVVKLENGEIFNYTFIDENTDCTNNESNICESSTMYENHLNSYNKVSCNICGKDCFNKTLLQRHQNECHGIEMPKEHICPYCSKVSPNKQAHRQHIRINHIMGRAHACPICGKKFKFPSYLKDHISTHTGIALHNCPYCSRSFKSGANMYTHRKKVHPKEWQEERMKKLAAQNLKKLSLDQTV